MFKCQIPKYQISNVGAYLRSSSGNFYFWGLITFAIITELGAEALKFDSLSPASPIINLKSDAADWHRQSAPLKYWSICLVKLNYTLFITFASNLKKCPFFWILPLWHLQRKHFWDFDGLEISCSNLMYAKYFSEFEYSAERSRWVSAENQTPKNSAIDHSSLQKPIMVIMNINHRWPLHILLYRFWNFQSVAYPSI